ncbi:MAG: hypothetical protein ACP5HG_11580 [Anaerolineae bacterium]
MQIVANESRIKTRTKIGERAPFLGLLVLAVSTVLIFVRPEWIWATMALVWVGFLISLTGSYLGDRYVGPNAHHKKVPAALKGMDDDYTLLMYETATPFILVEPGGLTVLTVKSQGGTVIYEGGRWKHRQRMGILRRFAGQESLSQPHKMAQAEQEYVEDMLAKRLPEEMDVPVRGVILFTNDDVLLEVDEESVPVPALRAAELKRWLRRNPLRPQLSDEVREALADALELEEGTLT